MKKLLRYMKGYGKECILAPLFKMLEASFELFVPLVVAVIIDEAIPAADSSLIIKNSLVLVALALIGFSCSLVAQFFSARAAVGFTARIRHALMEKIGRLSYTGLDSKGSSTLIARLTNDSNQVQNGVNLTLRLLLRSPFVVFGAMVMAFTVDVKAALVFAVTIPALSVVVFGIMLSTIPLYKKVQSRLDGVLSKTRENLTGTRVIRAFCLEGEEAEEFDRRNHSLTAAQKVAGRISAIMNPLTLIIVNLAVIAVIYIGDLQVSAGELSRGEVVALYNYMSQILVELVKMASLIISITKAVACGNRISAVLDAEEIEPDRTVGGAKSDATNSCGGENILEFKGVSFTYSGASEPSLEEISFAVGRGETLGIIGGTGSGKTTLIDLIPRFYEATDGEILVDGRPVGDYALKDLRAKIGVVPQKAALFRGSIRDNLTFDASSATDADILAAAEIAQATEIIEGKGGLDFEIEEGGKNLSGGQKQRLTIARALVGKPEILILDDSASALDYATDAHLRTALRSIPHAPTVIIVSQRAASIRHADKIIVLDDGHVVGIGNDASLRNSCPVYREICESQERE